MSNNFDFKLIISLIASGLVIYSYVPYIRDIFLRKTQPHLYTWLLWAITQGTATVAMWRGGGNWGVLSFAIGTILLLFVLALSFKYGTKNIKRSDAVALFSAIAAILVWWQLSNPLLAVIMVSAIDGLGYFPTLRKSFEEPWSETLSFWFIMAAINVLVIISLAEYNFLTIIYPAMAMVANAIIWSICFFRRKRIQNPATVGLG